MFVGIGVLVLIAAWVLLTENKDSAMVKDEMMKSDTEMMEKDGDAMLEGTKEGDGMMNPPAGGEGAMMEGDSMMKKGSYEAYSPEKLAFAETGDVVLFFRASWCPTCKAIDADIRAHLSAIPSGLTILDVDYDNSSALKQKYGVTYQHTFVQVDSKGAAIKKWSGTPTLAALVAEVQ